MELPRLWCNVELDKCLEPSSSSVDYRQHQRPADSSPSAGMYLELILTFSIAKCFMSRKTKPSVLLRTVPTFVTAHTFCASWDTRVSFRWCLLIQGYFYVVLNYAEKAELNKCSWYPKRKFGVTMYFLEIIKLHFGKKKMHGCLQFSFWISIALAEICFSRIVVNHTKILLY